MHSVARRRRAWLGVWVTLCALLVSATPAGAALEGLSTIEVDSDMHWWSQPNVVSNERYQWIAYWDALEGGGEIHAQVSRRRLSDNRVDTIRFDGTRETTSIGLNNVNDAHDYIQLGMSKNDGRLHISWSDHHGEHYYARSAGGCLTAASFTGESCRFDWSRNQDETQRDIDRDGRTSVPTEGTFTYPWYFNDSRGRLYMSYRFGESSRGTHYLNSYDEATGRWRSRGKLLWGRREARARYTSPVPAILEPFRAATEETSEIRGPYIWGWEFDKNDRLHIMWAWRELFANEDYFHDYYYAYSDDYGATWHTSAEEEEPFARTGEDPITIADEGTLVLSAPPGAHPYGGRLAFDSDNRPHLVFTMNEGEVANSPVDTQMRMRHLWRGTDGNWYNSWIGSTSQQGWVGELVIDGADNLNFVYNKTLFDWIPIWEYPWTQLWLSSDLVTWQSDGERRGHLAVTVKSEITCIDTRELIGTAIESRGNNQLRLRVQNRTDARELQLWFKTQAEPTWSSRDRLVTARVTENERNYAEVAIDLSRTGDWTGTLRTLEICMMDPRADAGDEFNVDWVRVTNAEGRAAKSWEFDEVGSQLHVATVSSANNWGGEWSIRPLLPEVSDTWSDNPFLVDRDRYRETGLVTFPMIVQGTPGNERMTLREYRVTGDTIRKQWTFDISETDWAEANDVSELRWASDGGAGTLQGTITDNDSAIDSAPNLGVRLSARTVEVRMKHSAGSELMLCWITNNSRTWNLRRCARRTGVVVNGRHNTYNFETRGWENWRSEERLYQLRLEPSNSSEVRSGTFNVDSIKLVD